MPKPKRKGFYCELPPNGIAELRRRARKAKLTQWAVIYGMLMRKGMK